MNVKLRLFLWTAALVVAVVVLLGGASWPGAADPAVAAMAVIRIVAGVLAAYLLASTALAVVAAVTRSQPLGRLAGTVSSALVRRLVAAALGGGLLVTPVAASADVRRPPAAEAPVLRRLPEADPQISEATPPNTAASDAEDAEEVVVSPGDHLWAIAERTLAGRLGRPPTEAEVVPYWRTLIDANRSRFVHADDPDLVLPGQTFVLP